MENPLVEVATEVPENGVDDIYVAIIVGNIDGPGGRYAEAGQTLVTNDGRIAAGSLKIDPNDIQLVLDRNIFDWLMLHELAHVLGVGERIRGISFAFQFDKYVRMCHLLLRFLFQTQVQCGMTSLVEIHTLELMGYKPGETWAALVTCL